MIKDEIMSAFREYLKGSYTCHEGDTSEIPEFEGYYARSTCEYGEVTYTAYNDPKCQDEANVMPLSYYNIDCWHIGNIEGIDVYLSCEFT